ncbi:MAG: hypothetical protein M3R59_02215 [Verrucomicrobiota bacterium]|nr:hypothetical protein [Verrucomicrobiota bacterium]
MKKLLLIIALAGGFIFVGAPKSEAGISVGIGFGGPVGYGYYPYGAPYYAAYPAYYPYGYYRGYYGGPHYRVGYRPYYWRHGRRIYHARRWR